MYIAKWLLERPLANSVIVVLTHDAGQTHDSSQREFAKMFDAFHPLQPHMIDADSADADILEHDHPLATGLFENVNGQLSRMLAMRPST